MVTPMKDVENKVAFVTGGASGIGLGIVRSFLDAGMHIAIGDISREHTEGALKSLRSAKGRVYAIEVDVTDRSALESAAETVVNVFGKVHVLVNNAGVQNPVGLSSMSYDEWDKLIAVNLGGVFNGIRAFLPHIRQHGEGGQIITTASMFGLFTAGPCYGAYCASKFATVAMMEALRAELESWNVGVSVVCPGAVRSNLESFLKDLEVAADPTEIGRVVLQGMKSNDLYILTHPEFNRVIQCRTDAILASNPKDVHPSRERHDVAQLLLRRSIYVAERSRHSNG